MVSLQLHSIILSDWVQKLNDDQFNKIVLLRTPQWGGTNTNTNLFDCLT